MVKVFFHEKQSLSRIRKLLVLGMITIVMGFVLIMIYLKEWDSMPQEEKPFLWFLLAGPLASLVIFLIHVDLRITDSSVQYLVSPFRKKYKIIPMDQIESFEIIHLKGIQRYRNMGVNYRNRNREMYFGGSHILKIHLKKGYYILFGTSKPRELEHFLSYVAENGPKLNVIK